MTVDDLSRIDRTIEVNAPPDKVWRALTTAKDLSTWFKVTVEGDIAPGAEVWMTSRYPGHEGTRFVVRITEMTPPRRFVWQWHPGAVDPERRLLARAVDDGHLHAGAVRHAARD